MHVFCDALNIILVSSAGALDRYHCKISPLFQCPSCEIIVQMAGLKSRRPNKCQSNASKTQKQKRTLSLSYHRFDFILERRPVGFLSPPPMAKLQIVLRIVHFCVRGRCAVLSGNKARENHEPVFLNQEQIFMTPTKESEPRKHSLRRTSLTATWAAILKRLINTRCQCRSQIKLACVSWAFMGLAKSKSNATRADNIPNPWKIARHSPVGVEEGGFTAKKPMCRAWRSLWTIKYISWQCAGYSLCKSQLLEDSTKEATVPVECQTIKSGTVSYERVSRKSNMSWTFFLRRKHKIRARATRINKSRATRQWRNGLN